MSKLKISNTVAENEDKNADVQNKSVVSLPKQTTEGIRTSVNRTSLLTSVHSIKKELEPPSDRSNAKIPNENTENANAPLESTVSLPEQTAVERNSTMINKTISSSIQSTERISDPVGETIVTVDTSPNLETTDKSGSTDQMISRPSRTSASPDANIARASGISASQVSRSVKPDQTSSTKLAPTQSAVSDNTSIERAHTSSPLRITPKVSPISTGASADVIIATSEHANETILTKEDAERKSAESSTSKTEDIVRKSESRKPTLQSQSSSKRKSAVLSGKSEISYISAMSAMRSSSSDTLSYPSRGSMMSTSKQSTASGRRSLLSSRRVSSVRRFSEVSTTKNPLDDMKNSELVNAVNELEKNAKHLELENMVFLHFLQKNDPTLIEGMETVLKNAQTMQDRASISSRRLTLTRASRRDSIFLSYSTSSMIPVAVEKEGPRINVTQKTDLILREMDDIQAALEKVNRRCHIAKHKLRAELEEMAIREVEIQETMKTFEDVFINESVEKFTQKNPADRFCRFMEECFKKTLATIDKLCLRTSSLKVQYQKLSNQLTQKKLLGENLQEVDFEQLQIENKHLRIKIDKRNLLLLELKKMNGHAHLLLSTQKKHLLKKMDDLKEFQDTIKLREGLVTKLDDECEKVSAELEATKAEYDKIKTKSENYEVPAVIDYVKKKAELSQLKKNLKIWARRKQIKDMALNASVREMKHVTGSDVPKASWFTPREFHRARGSFESTFEFMFERVHDLPQISRKKKGKGRRKNDIQA